ncbi:C6 transcription factor [Colletotrichum higginsianum IMI 349063]|uniref:C6 transcription factor n=1 Tax=Colletotrichum higginsianum (strain IMI 349063) TaxID=759273 RepID=A0A1B7YDX8_COLHI|nr:C6 transcription factor [Colletotrichum higginsianum IMI 349063]OBR10273.1 C6 transcription factor [Colletotrichum higginsianum IMI 349063]
MLSFFKFPRELRDAIYRQYVTFEGGYVLNPETNRMRGAVNDLPVDLALMYTCKRVAEEMKGLPLKANTLTFSTFYPPEHRVHAGYFHLAMRELHGNLDAFVCLLPRRFLHEDIQAEITDCYPKYEPVIEMMRTKRDAHREVIPSGPFGETPSTHRSFIRFVLQTLSFYRFRFNDEFGRLCDNAGQSPMDIARLIDYSPAPWAIPTQQEVEEMLWLLYGTHTFEEDASYGLWDNDSNPGLSKFRYSAVAVAIRFLESVTPAHRAQIRHIKLMEDRESVSNPECHALGLIPFCRENPLLRVERHISLWRNVFLHHTAYKTFFDRLRFEASLEANEISGAVALWIMEALALGPAGMPSGSFTLVLDGDGDTRCSEIFQTVVLRDAAWQEAMDECYSRGILPPQPWAKRRQNPRSRGDGPGGVAYEKAANHSYLYEGFPQAIRDIVNGTSVVRCNFDPGEYEDVEQLIETRKTWTLAEWKGKWYERVTKSFEPSPPLPSWKDILREFLLE